MDETDRPMLRASATMSEAAKRPPPRARASAAAASDIAEPATGGSGEPARPRPVDAGGPAVGGAVDGWRRRDVLDLDDFDRDEIDLVMRTTDAMREVLGRAVRRVPTLRGTTIITMFYEASTRTRASFELAAKVLGADVINVSASGSSVEKGESLVDTVRTLEAIGADALVIRHGASGAPYLAAQHTAAAIINAGDGTHAHPSQALLDLYTMRQRLGDMRGRRVVIVGDILHSRVARSNLWALTTMGAEVVVCGPPTLIPAGLGDAAEPGLPPVRVEYDADVALRDADVVMTLRVQAERQDAGLLPSLREYARRYQLNTRRLALARPGALVMHPGPMLEGVEIAPDVAHGVQSVIEEQVRTGVAVRMALLYLTARGHAL